MNESVLSVDTSAARGGGIATAAVWVARLAFAAASSVVVFHFLRR